MAGKTLTVILNNEGVSPPPASLGQQIKETLLGLADFLLAVVMLIVYSLEAIYKKFVPDEPKSVKGEIVLITGTGHGIGRELALLYAKNDAIVVGVDVNEENNRNTIKEIQAMGKVAHNFTCDISKREEVEALGELVKTQVGEVTILINNAGIMRPRKFLEQPVEDIEATMKINILAHFWTLRAFLPSMKKNNYGHVVSLSSMAGIMGQPNLTGYCASKFGVVGLMESLHEELRQENPKNQIKFTNICPYIIDTGLCKKTQIKYSTLMPVLSPSYVAEFIMNAQRTDKVQVSIPAALQTATLLGRLMPIKAAIFLKDRYNAVVLPDC